MRREFLHQLLPRAVGRAAQRLGPWLALLLLWLASAAFAPAQAQSVELQQLKLQRRDGELTLEFSTRLSLGAAIEDALHRGVPMYFTAQATVYRNRWYWRDERVARASRSWRLAYQPLTASWRLSLGGLAQSYDSLSDALATLSRVSGWPLMELDKIEPGERYYVEFVFKLDNSQLPQPMQIDLGGDWKLGIERSLRVE
jgi:hypothetical protein